MKLSTKLAALAAAVVGGTALTGIAVAGIPAADGTITACVSSAGAPRIIDTEAGQTCAAGERQINWSSGWRHRGTYDSTKTYQVGDIVIVHQPCGTTAARYVVQPATFIKVTPDPEYGGCPYSNFSWQFLSKPMDRVQLPKPTGPVSFRIGANDSGTYSSEVSRFVVQTWNYGDVAWIYTSGMDARRCRVTASAVSDIPVVITRSTASYANWIPLNVRTHTNGFTRVPIDVVLDCPVQLSGTGTTRSPRESANATPPALPAR